MFVKSLYRRVSTLVFTVLFSSQIGAKDITIFKQWHLLSSQKTDNIKKSLKLPQAKNQHDLFNQLLAFSKKNPNGVVFYEGCEGKIIPESQLMFNSWNWKKLEKKKSKKVEYGEILTHLGLKLEVLLGNSFDNQCGDDLALIKKHQLAFSDLRAYFGFYQRLLQFKSNPRKFNRYKEILLKGEKDKSDPIAYALKKAKKSFLDLEKYLKERNNSFVKKVIGSSSKKIGIVIGGLHVLDLKEKLEKKGLKVTEYTPIGYPKEDQSLLKEMKKLLFKK